MTRGETAGNGVGEAREHEEGSGAVRAWASVVPPSRRTEFAELCDVAQAARRPASLGRGRRGRRAHEHGDGSFLFLETVFSSNARR